MTAIPKLLYQIKVSEQQISQLFEERLAISLTRYQLLEELLAHEPCSQKTLEDLLQIDRAAITRHMKILEERGYVQKVRNPKNQREMTVYATDKAKRDLSLSPPEHHLQIKEEMEHILSDDEKVELSRLLNKLVNGLEDIEYLKGEKN